MSAKLTNEERKRRKNERSKAWKLENPEKTHEANQNWYARHKGYNKYNVKKRLEALAGCRRPKMCPICKSSKRISFDHCHKSKQFRGWLCHSCNVALGYAKDSQIILRKLADYLDVYEMKHQPVRREVKK